MFPYCQLCDSARRHTGEQLSAAYDGQTFTAPRHPEDLNSFTSVTLTDISGARQAAGRLDALRADHDQRRDRQREYRNTPGPLSFDGKSFGLTVK
jgi:hypothetical protein